MRNLTTIAVLGTLALAACGKPAETPEAAATTEAATMSEPAGQASAPVAAATPAPGEYSVSDKDGKAVATVTLNADSTYRRQPAKGLAEAGIMKMVDGKTCFDPSGSKEAVCYVDSARAADGSFTAIMDDGTVLNVKPAAK